MNYSKPEFEVGSIIRQYRHLTESSGRLSSHKKKVFTHLSQCRTEALGYHKDKCDNDDCQYVHISYNSCRDRHCPKCNGIKREKWVNKIEADLLPVKYFHVVFTVPAQVNYLFILYPEKMFALLFKSAWQAVRQFAADHKHLGAKTGMTAVLHTWGQNLCFHPHVHCIIPGGGITKQGKWRNTKNQGKYLFPVKALSKVFRGIFTDELMKLDREGIISLETKFDKGRKWIHPFYDKRWVVYAKLPMHNPKQVLDYIGRYSHRIAISNHRIKAVENQQVSFSWFDYRTSKSGILQLSAEEFLRRFSMHILPAGFMKIRHYGINSSCSKKQAIETVREDLKAEAPENKKDIPWRELFEKLYGRSPDTCPKCGKGKMIRIYSYLPQNKTRGSPIDDIAPNYDFYRTDSF